MGNASRIKVFWVKIRKRILSKKFLLIFSIFSILLLTLYVGSYRHLRNKFSEISIEMKKAKPKRIPSGYYIEIVFGTGLSAGDTPPKGYAIYPYVHDNGKWEICNWLGYLYYPLIILEIKTWQIKNFGWGG